MSDLVNGRRIGFRFESYSFCARGAGAGAPCGPWSPREAAVSWTALSAAAAVAYADTPAC